jgi:hypothetical protein
VGQFSVSANNEDHVFFVLQGAADFYGPNAECRSVCAGQGVMLPHGTFYRFMAQLEQPLVMIRVGCAIASGIDVHARINMSGKPLAGNSKENKQVKTVFSEKWFGVTLA